MSLKERLRWSKNKWRLWVDSILYSVEFSCEEIGEITFEDLNNASLGASQVDVVFVGKKPEGKELVNLYFKVLEEFKTDIYGEYHEYSGDNAVTNLEVVKVLSFADGDAIPEKKAGDITVKVTLESGNSQNWISGRIRVYAKLRDYPV